MEPFKFYYFFLTIESIFVMNRVMIVIKIKSMIFPPVSRNMAATQKLAARIYMILRMFA